MLEVRQERIPIDSVPFSLSLSTSKGKGIPLTIFGGKLIIFTNLRTSYTLISKKIKKRCIKRGKFANEC